MHEKERGGEGKEREGERGKRERGGAVRTSARVSNGGGEVRDGEMEGRVKQRGKKTCLIIIH